MFALRVMSICAVLNVVFARPNNIVEMSDGEIVPRKIDHITLYKEAKNFRCQPQPRSFLVKDLLTDPQDASYSFHPPNIVLHRCDKQSGCCLNNTQYCGPLKSEKVIIQLQGFVHEIRNGVPSIKDKKPFEITEFNHTDCACADESSPKRNDANDAKVESLTSAGLTNNPNEYKLSLCVASLLYFIYLSYSFCL